MSDFVHLGDYVLASKYSDCDPKDPWRVGYVVRIIQDAKGTTYVVGEKDGTWSDFREYKHARRITHDEGRDWLNFHKDNT
jgi:hypothetical protein